MMLRRLHGGRARFSPVRTLELDWRERIGASDEVCAAWESMPDAARQPWRERERAALDAYIADIEASLRGC